MLRSALRNGARIERTEPPKPREAGLVVIHGVGETEPGYAVNTLLETLASEVPGYQLSRKSSLQWLDDGATECEGGNRKIRKFDGDLGEPRFPVASRDARYQNHLDITAVELHWSDLTNLQPGKINATLASFRVIFESHHLVDAMLRRGRDQIAAMLRWLLWIASWMMRGPIAALTVATAGYCIFLLFGPVIPIDQQSAALPAAALPHESWLDMLLGRERRRFILFELGVLCGAGLWLAWIVRNKDMTWYDTAFWSLVVAALLLLFDATGLLAQLLVMVPSLKWGEPVNAAVCMAERTYAACYIDGLYRMIIWGWRIYGIILIIALAALVLRAFKRLFGTKDPSLAPIGASIATVILQFMMWTTIVVTLLYTMLNRAEVNRDLSKARDQIVSTLVKSGVDTESAAFKFFQFPNVDFEWIDRFKFIYAMTALTVVLAIVVAVRLVVKRRRTAAAGAVDLETTAQKMPRVLFSPILVGTLIVQFLLLVTLILFQRALEEFDWFKEARKWFLPFAALVAVAVPFALGHRAANFVHIARDLIDHQFKLRIESMRWFMPGLFAREEEMPRRAKIQQRLAKVIDQLARERNLSDLVFVAHSQGSVVAFDYIRDHIENHGALANVRIQFLSFGSPLGHIYQKYFYEYRPESEDWLKVALRVDRWSNLYRVDDPIGGFIELPEDGDIENVPLPPPGGHMNYWGDRRLAAALHGLIQLSVSSPVYASTPAATLPRPMPPLPVSEPTARFELQDNLSIPRSMPRL